MLFRVVSLLFLFFVAGTAVGAMESGDPEKLDETISTAFMSDMVQHVYFEDSAIPVSQANKVLQTGDGYIWIASYDGLIRFDGKNAKIYGIDDGLESTSIADILEDSRGRLWIASNNAGLFLYETGKGFRRFTHDEGLTSDTLRKLGEDSEGNIYAATHHGLFVISPEMEVSQVRRGRSRNPISCRSVMVDSGDNIWCIRDNGSVLVLRRPGNVVREIRPSDMDSYEFNALFQDSSGKIYVGTTDSRVFLYNHAESEYRRILDTGEKTSINSFGEDSRGRVWVCADNGMGFFLDGVFHPVDGAIVDSSLENMFEDYEGGYWFASSRKGVLHASRSKFRNVNLANRLPELTVNTTRLYNGKLYIGSDEGLFIVRTNGDQVENELTELLKGVRVRSFVTDDAGSLWICTYGKFGVIRYREDGTLVPIGANRGLPHNRVRCALPLPGGVMAVGTSKGVCFIKDDWVVGSIGREEGMTNSVILSLCLGEGGMLYAGSDGGGVYCIDESGIAGVITTEDGLASNIILRMATDPDRGGMWISTGNALSFFKDGIVRRLEGLDRFSSSVFDIKFGREDGRVWLLSSKGVWVVEGEDVFGSGVVRAELFTRRDGLSSSVTANSWSHLHDDGRLFLSCSRGVIVTDIDDVLRHTTKPKLAISRVIIDDEVYERPKSVVIPSDARRVSIDFAVLSYVYTTGNEATIYLKGFDEQPVTVSTDQTTFTSYTNLSGGEYEFHIVSENKDGARSDLLVLPLRKRFGVLERSDVRAGLGFGSLLAIFGLGRLLYRYKTRALRKRQEEYREITEQAISAIADTIDAKDEYTAGHSKRVASYSREIAKRLGIRGEDLENLYYTALLHDIGKIGLEDAILKKRGGLTDDEYAKMKRHTSIGGDILRSITVVRNIEDGARYHHERYDGRGYPRGLRGEEIPLTARIICVADAFDAMSTDRPYRDSLDQQRIIDELVRCSGAHFDERIVPVMVDLLKRSLPVVSA